MPFSAKSVKKFNALARHPKAPSGMVPNQWHFDLRYIPLEPTPSHLLFIVQIESSFVYSERLPLDVHTQSTGIDFFPGRGPKLRLKDVPPPHAPWKLTTEDPTLADAVGKEFKRLGVRDELCTISVVKGRPLEIAQEAFSRIWNSIKAAIAITGLAAAALTCPSAIMFENIKLDKWGGKDGDDDSDKALAYTQRLMTTRPLSKNPQGYAAVGQDMIKEMQANLMIIESKLYGVVCQEADEGNGESAIDLALRLQFGINCTPSRRLFRTYLVKAIASTSSSPATKSQAHALLIDWQVRA
ncbi:hypothetical protein H0H81_007016 [Sphagnurus paluster]|uniref:Uncharacterized protein n=1 Tax=Sphagnurus paluster TaxID=117069 RepID=A0A9P7G224_9AGAR|nr:hypothetical protein H0H81_007016 [Sphagnurus paluster]